MKRQVIILSLLLYSCKGATTWNSETVNGDSAVNTTNKGSLFKSKMFWLDSANVLNRIDTTLMHTGYAFLTDSAVAIDYTGFEGEHIYLPLNEKGQWINTIEKTKKLSSDQLKLIHSVLGKKKSFESPMMYACYEPRFGIVYYKDNKVIAQSAICIDCARTSSTAKLGDGSNYSSFNEQALKKLSNLCNELHFSNCNP